MIRAARDTDADAIARIYAPYVTDTVITFEEEPVPVGEMGRRVAEVQAAGLPWVVAEIDGEVLGYAYAGPWKSRSAYRFTVETSVYLTEGAQGRGLGRALYADVLATAKELGKHVAIGGIALPNAASVALHERMGFSKVAHHPEVGRKFGRWIDVGYWQRAL